MVSAMLDGVPEIFEAAKGFELLTSGGVGYPLGYGMGKFKA